MSTAAAKKTFAEQLAIKKPKIAAFLRLIIPAGETFEIRALDVGDYNQTYAGFFNDPDIAAEAVARMDMQQAPRGIYTTINPVQSELLCRINNKLIKAKRGEMAADKHVTRRLWLFIDIDPERAGGISGIPASDEERLLAEDRSENVCDWLMTGYGWHEPIRMDSGNGRYLFFPISLPNDNDSTLLIKLVLAGIASKWSDDKVKIDVSVHNAARIARVFLTANRKGDSTEARPHRLCQGLTGPDYLKNGHAEPIPREKLEAVAALAPKEERRQSAVPASNRTNNHINGHDEFNHRLKVAEWLIARGIGFREPHTLADGRECFPIVCPFNSDHDYDAAIMQSANGAMGARCLHQSCSQHNWQSFKEAIGKPDAEHYDPPLTLKAVQPSGQSDNFSGTPIRPNEAIDDPHRLARIFLNEKYALAGQLRTIVYYQGEYWFWNGAAYVPMKGYSLSADLTASIKQEFDRINLKELEDFEPTEEKPDPPKVKPVTRTLLHNVENAVASMTAISDSLTMPCWLGPARDWPAREILATRRRLIHLPSLISGERAELDPTPEFFSTVCLDFDYDPKATCPIWLQFLSSVWRSDQQSIDTLQEFIGYLLVWDASQHKMLLLIGPARSGKGTIARVLMKLLGEGNVASPTLSNFGGSFGLWPLLNKSVALIPDARLSGREDSTLIVERLLSISGQDPQDVHRKCQATLTGVRMAVRFLLMSNELPNLKDISGAFMSRVLLLQMTESFLGREDRTLDGRLERELPGILNWAIDGWKRLRQRGHFIQPESANQMLEEFANLSSPIRQFIKERCLVGPQYEISTEWLFQAWGAWCADNGRDHTGTTQTFGRDLRAALPCVSTGDRRRGTERGRVYVGIAVKTDFG